MTPKNCSYENKWSTLSSLRRLIPERQCQFSEALRIAELQAARLLQLMGVDAAPVPNEIVSELPRIEVQYRSIPMSGLSYWNGHDWVIGLNRTEPRTRQRFTLLHEYKHIVDHGRVKLLYPDRAGATPEKQAEQAADYFAGCVLMPRMLVKRAWANGLQTPEKLARHFQTSERAVAVRLAQIGLVDQTDRHGGRATYRRSASISHLQLAKESAT